MLKRALSLALGLGAITLPLSAQTQAADHLVISEVGIYATSGYSNAPESAEYIEIYNPTDAAVDLTNYYVTDFERYFELPAIVALQTDNLLNNGSDFLLKFPDGASIPAGGVVVVTNNAEKFAEAYFDKDVNNFLNQPGSPQLFETYDSDPSIPEMGLNYNKRALDYPLPGGTPNPDGSGTNLSHTDAGENCVLFYWEEDDPLVKDVDIVQWRPHTDDWGDSADQVRDKSGQPGYPTGNYAIDAGFSNGHATYLDINYQPGPRGQVVRRTLLEVGETHTGGNGITGDDESMEHGDVTWHMLLGTPSNASPGVTHLTRSSQNQAPVIMDTKRDVKHPAPGDTVRITARVFDDGNFTARLMVDKGTGVYSPVTMTDEGNDVYGADITTNGLAEGTIINWYVEATDDGGLTASEGDYLSMKNTFRGHHAFQVKTTPYTSADLLVTEIMYDPQGYDNYTHSHYVEIYNPGSSPLNVSSFVFTTNYWYGDGVEAPHPSGNNNTTYVTFPDGTIIPPNDYLVIAGNKTLFMSSYPGMDPDRVIDCDITPKSALMAHARGTLYFFGPNEFGYDNNPVDLSSAFKSLYYDTVMPWPESPAQNQGARNTGYSIELTTLTPGADETGSMWEQGKVINGTPLEPNSVDTTQRPGDVSVISASRDLLFPQPGQSITITAQVSSSIAIDTAQVFVETGTGTGYTATPMTTSDGVTFTGTIGGFPDQTLVKYYVEATDTSGNKSRYPYAAPQRTIPFHVQAVTALDNAIVLNEIMYDPAGSDNSTFPEYYELYNSTDAPIDVSFYAYGSTTDLMGGGNNQGSSGRIIPEGTVIPAKGYLVLTADKPLFVQNYIVDYPNYFWRTWGPIDPDLVIGSAWQPTSLLSNGNATHIYLGHTNEIDWDTNTFTPFVDVNYQLPSPWPAAGETLNGPSIELKDPSLAVTDPTHWAISLSHVGTPGTRNSVTPPPSSVSDWSVY